MSKKLSPYWHSSNVEESKRIISEIYDKPESERNSLGKKLLDAHLEKWNDHEVPPKTTQRTRKYKLKPTKDQIKVLRNWEEDARNVYNVTVGKLKNTSEKLNKRAIYELRDDLTVMKRTTVTDPGILLGMKRTPHKVREKANFEAIQAHNLSLKKLSTINPKYKSFSKALALEKKQLVSIENKLGKRKKGVSELEAKREILKDSIGSLEKDLEFIPKYLAKVSKLKNRSKKDCYANFTIPKVNSEYLPDEKCLRIYPSYFRAEGLRVKGLKESPHHDFQIRWHRRTNQWWVLVPETIEIKPKGENYRTVAYDPGIRTFQTGFDLVNSKNVEEIEPNWVDTKRGKRKGSSIRNRLERIDKAASSGKKLTPRAKGQLELDRKKILNIIDNLHKQVAKKILDNYDVIVLPKLRTKRMLKRFGGLGKENNRILNILSHGKFHDYMKWKAMTLGKIVIDQNEAYTTQTCCQCGYLTDIGSLKIFECDHCDNICDRDIQSSLNIMTRYMGSYTSSFPP